MAQLRMRTAPEAGEPTPRRPRRTITWVLVALLIWLLVRLAIVLTRDFWVILIAWSQP
jgi:uncharacterized membrane protein